MPRSFIAIDLPPEIKKQIAKISFGLPGARFVTDEQLHLTLHFLGELDGTQFNDLADQLTTIESDPIELELNGVGCFPKRGSAKILWVGVAPTQALNKLHKQMERLLKGCGIKTESRRFTPHITIARLKEVSDTKLAIYLQDHALFKTTSFTVDEFHLFTSQLAASGSIHTQEYSYPLIIKSELTTREKWQRGLE